jgi:hypothetical protein
LFFRHINRSAEMVANFIRRNWKSVKEGRHGARSLSAPAALDEDSFRWYVTSAPIPFLPPRQLPSQENEDSKLMSIR